MCTPLAAMASTAVGTVQQMQSASAQANYQSQVAENNATLANRQAESNSVAGAQEAQRVSQQSKTLRSQQTAAMGANGVDTGAGSPLDILSDTTRNGALDKANTEYNSAQNTWALQNQANDYKSQAGAYRSAGKNNRTSALLTGVSSLAGQYSGYKKTGAFK